MVSISLINDTVLMEQSLFIVEFPYCSGCKDTSFYRDYKERAEKIRLPGSWKDGSIQFIKIDCFSK